MFAETSSVDGVATPQEKDLGSREANGQLVVADHASLRERVSHFTWAWFTLTMSTGGISNLINAQPHRFNGQTTLGKLVFIIFIVLLLFNLTMISARFILVPRALKSSLTHPTESLFFPCMWLSFAVLLMNAQAFGVPSCGAWLVTTLRVLFWMYAALTFIIAVGHYHLLFSAGRHMSIHSMTPAWILPVFPAMLTGSVASAISASQPFDQRLPIIVAGVAYQGLGFLISLIMMALYLSRLMADGLPDAHLRPGMFMAVGPPSFTALALMGLANNLPRGYDYFADNPLAIDVLQPLALVFSIFLWMFAFFFFCIAAVACIQGWKELPFSLICWAFVFPNTGFAIATIDIGTQLRSEGIRWVGSIMTVLLVVVWLANLGFQVRAIWLKRMLWPGKDEDREGLKRKKH
ncbi:voltage-dependent anion channel [Lophiotrema nucula]|uniref:Voltage-dependent anion channel n=1 Tax=Lophiotrema nucula TaxID=690887 RepID=A0A6A5ZB45_9PLEO|nr:voltage-dependent anion channel [Lophiotrema nucula]